MRCDEMNGGCGDCCERECVEAAVVLVACFCGDMKALESGCDGTHLA